MINRFKDIIYNILFREKVYITPDKTLNGQVVVISGASRGIGKAVAEVLLKKGASVTLVARDVSNLRNLQSNSRCLIIAGDVTSKDSCQEIATKTFTKFGSIDGLINCAGLYLEGEFEQVSEKQFDEVFETNIKGIFLMTQAVVPFMKQAKGGIIVNLGSRISHNSAVKRGKVLYAATKYGVEGFSYALGRELRNYGIRVSCLMPGTVKTFRSARAHEFLSPHKIGELISMLIMFEDIHFEGLIFNSLREDLDV